MAPPPTRTRAAELGLWDESGERGRVIELMMNQDGIANVESRFCAKDGSTRIGSVSASIIELDGEPHIIPTIRDITELRRTERAY